MYSLDEVLEILKSDKYVIAAVKKYGPSNLIVKTAMQNVIIIQSRIQKDIIVVIEIPHSGNLEFLLSEIF